MPKCPWPNARYRPWWPPTGPRIGRLSGVDGRNPSSSAPRRLQRREQPPRVVHQDLGAPFVGRGVEAGDLHRAGHAQPVLHRGHEEGPGLIADRDRRRDAGGEQHGVVAALGLQRHPDTQSGRAIAPTTRRRRPPRAPRCGWPCWSSRLAAAFARDQLHRAFGDHRTAGRTEQFGQRARCAAD